MLWLLSLSSAALKMAGHGFEASALQQKFFRIQVFFVFLTFTCFIWRMGINLWQVHLLVPKIRPKSFIFLIVHFSFIFCVAAYILMDVHLLITKNRPISLLFLCNTHYLRVCELNSLSAFFQKREFTVPQRSFAPLIRNINLILRNKALNQQL